MERPEDHFYAPVLAGPRQRQCPDCGGLMIRRTSERQGLLSTEILYQCDFLLCAASFKGYEEIFYRLKVPLQVNPLIHLPVSPSQKVASPVSPELKANGAYGCPECGEMLRKQMTPTKEPGRFAVYVECARNGCGWAMEGVAHLELTKKPDPVRPSAVVEPLTGRP